MKTYLFHLLIEGKPYFYPVELRDDADAIANAHHNKGTLKVTTPTGALIFKSEFEDGTKGPRPQ